MPWGVDRVRNSRRPRHAWRLLACSLGAVVSIALAAPPAWAAAPAAPPKPTVVANDSQIVVSFSPPADDGGKTIDSYTATCVSSDLGPLGSSSATTSPVAVPATNGHMYTCHVTATNADGTSPPSPDSDPVLVAGVPDQMAQPTVTIGNKQIMVAFTPPANNGSPIGFYTATCTSSDGGRSNFSSAAASPVTVPGLSDGHTYTCTVVAANSVGGSPPSPASAAVVPVDVPGAPPLPHVVRGDTKIVVSFSAADADGSPITKYTATCISNNGGAPHTTSAASSPIAVGGLTNGKTYHCRVSATNALGTGPASPASLAVIPAAPPAPPSVVSLASGPVASTSGALIISFKPGANNGTPISSYRVICTKVTGGASVVKTGTKSPIAVPGLATAKTYSCAAVAISTAGASVRSSASRATVGAPGAPTGVSAKRITDTSVQLRLNVPPNNGAKIASYTATCSSSNGGAKVVKSVQGSPISVSGLTAGKTYTCTVTATNSRGVGPASATTGAVVA